MDLTISIPDHLADRIVRWAELMQQPVPEMVEAALDVALPPLPPMQPPVASLTDEQLLALAHVQMDTQQGERLTHLQRQQREGSLSTSEKQEMMQLMQQYNALWVRQSQALALAVQRGLIPPLSA